MTKQITISKLKKLNLIAGTLHFFQGILVVILSKSLAIPITGNCLYIIASKYSDSAGTLMPNFAIASSELILTASAHYSTAKSEGRGNSSTEIPFTLNELNSNKDLSTFSNILSAIKAK